MTNYKKEVKSFSGKVTIQDIQEEFDRLINGINQAVDIINTMNTLQDRDFSKGSVKLSNSQYTMTLGSLKQVLNLYDGTTIGCTCIDTVGGTQLFPGLYVDKNYGIKQIPGDYITRNEYATDLFFNPQTGDYGFPAGEWYEDTSSSSPQSSYTNLSNNNVYGSITTNIDSTNAYLATTSTGFTWVINASNYQPGPYTLTLTWSFPQKVTLTGVGFTPSADVVIVTPTLSVKTLEGSDITSGVPSGGIETSGIVINFTCRAVRSMSIKNLEITLREPYYEIIGTPSEHGIQDLDGYKRIALLDWLRGEDILNTTEDFLFVQPTNKVNVLINNKSTGVNPPLNQDRPGSGAFFCPRVYPMTAGNYYSVTWDDIPLIESYEASGGSGEKEGSNWVWNPIWIPPAVELNILTSSPGTSYCEWKTYTMNTSDESEDIK